MSAKTAGGSILFALLPIANRGRTLLVTLEQTTREPVLASTYCPCNRNKTKSTYLIHPLLLSNKLSHRRPLPAQLDSGSTRHLASRPPGRLESLASYVSLAGYLVRPLWGRAGPLCYPTRTTTGFRLGQQPHALATVPRR